MCASSRARSAPGPREGVRAHVCRASGERLSSGKLGMMQAACAKLAKAPIQKCAGGSGARASVLHPRPARQACAPSSRPPRTRPPGPAQRQTRVRARPQPARMCVPGQAFRAKVWGHGGRGSRPRTCVRVCACACVCVGGCGSDFLSLHPSPFGPNEFCATCETSLGSGGASLSLATAIKALPVR